MDVDGERFLTILYVSNFAELPRSVFIRTQIQTAALSGNQDHLLFHEYFHEYFHGDNGAGLGASHQTGWTGLVAKLIQLYGYLDPKKTLEGGRGAAFLRQDQP